ncbi:hypothetical protein SAMN06264364_11094 [Quadrisphaera granulorum]|uniref:Polyketide cyclase/dehydrase/lipid transport protein n=1 Tax=Quadrisphaera granulorum TaxID=317664 RepID=A0A316A7K7_9ACTN|nr:hypothetical protein [Quadrisphaera granulorum]PWJ53851.1 hypothetical protein BXY45_11094 [Quadrisphaera granulorum]SZE96608.1 hypothetical protein SAMN06264364_11094 [Quadrisphaera granulorum]
MTWRREHTELTTASRDAVWRRWTTASAWVEDDPSLAAAELPSDLRVGSRGTVKNHGTPRQTITFTRLVPGRAMEFVINLPLARLSFPHSMTETEHGLQVTHAVELRGLLAPLFGVLVGNGIARGLPEVVRLVVTNALAERAGSAPATAEQGDRAGS